MTSRLFLRALASGAALVLGAAACSGSSSKSTPKPTARPDAKLAVRVGFVNVASVTGTHDLPAADQQALLGMVSAYVKAASVDPLEGHPATALPAMFVPTAAPALTGPEAATLTDTGLPKATGPVDTKLAPVSLHGLADATGAIDLVGATVDLTVSTRAAGGPITIHRTGQLMFQRDGSSWRILGFQLAVTRDGAGLGAGATSSTTKAGA